MLRRCLVALACCVLVCACPSAVDAQKKLTKEEEKKLLLEKAGKALMDTDVADFNKALIDLARAKADGLPYLQKAANFYASDLDKAQKLQDQMLIDALLARFKSVLRQIPIDKIDDRHAQQLAESFTADKKSEYVLIADIEFLGKLGPRAKAALPALKKIKPDPKKKSPMVAQKAIQQIEGK
jgi:hypothetical protein